MAIFHTRELAHVTVFLTKFIALYSQWSKCYLNVDEMTIEVHIATWKQLVSNCMTIMVKILQKIRVD